MGKNNHLTYTSLALNPRNGFALNHDKILQIYFCCVKRQAKNDFLKDVESTVGPGFEYCWRVNSAYDCMVLHHTEPFIIILSSSQYDLNNVERAVKHQTIIIVISGESIMKTSLFKYTENFTTKK